MNVIESYHISCGMVRSTPVRIIRVEPCECSCGPPYACTRCTPSQTLASTIACASSTTNNRPSWPMPSRIRARQPTTPKSPPPQAKKKSTHDTLHTTSPLCGGWWAGRQTKTTKALCLAKPQRCRLARGHARIRARAEACVAM